jgi:lysylphosphatidylglycerol synthetase-like protein (DUF2156 family)
VTLNDSSIAILAVVLVIVALGDLMAAIFFLYRCGRSKHEPEPGSEPSFVTRLLGGRSWLLAMMVAKSVIVAAVFSYFGLLVIRRLLELPQFDWSAPVSLAMIILLGIIPIGFAIAFYLTRRRNGMPPPFSESD